MADIYVDVGPMAFNKNTTKVPLKYTVNAPRQMRDTALKAIRSAPRFTPDKVGNPVGYNVNATLVEIVFGTYQGQPSVTCNLNETVSTYPRMQLLTSTLNGNATIAGDTTDGAVADCIKEAMKATMKKRVLPYLKQKPSP